MVREVLEVFRNKSALDEDEEVNVVYRPMKSILKLLLPFLVLCCWAPPAHADTISYSASGTFSGSTASSTFSGPSETWAFSFQADTHPTILEFGNGGFNFAFSNFSYSLNGSPVAIMPTFIRFFSGGNGGGFAICFNGTNAQNCTDALGFIFGPQMYTGMTSAPTLLPGPFTSDLGFVVNSAAFDLGNTAVQTTVTPEPSALLTLAAGLLTLGVRRRLYWCK
jgi:hypothetical protein